MKRNVDFGAAFVISNGVWWHWIGLWSSSRVE